MNLIWEESRVSTPERIFDKIKTEMAQPVGIVVVGVDGELKTEVVNRMMEELGGRTHFYVRTPIPNITELTRAFRGKPAVVVVLGSSKSSIPNVRRDLVASMREAGAMTVVEVYTKASKRPTQSFLTPVKDVQYNRAITEIEKHEPTADEANLLVPIREKA